MVMAVKRNKVRDPGGASDRRIQRGQPFGKSQDELDNLVVGVLDDLSFEIIRAYRNTPPPGYHEWVVSTATHAVRRLAMVICCSQDTQRLSDEELAVNCQPDAVRFMVAAWLLPQMERRFGPLPRAVVSALEAERTPPIGLQGRQASYAAGKSASG